MGIVRFIVETSIRSIFSLFITLGDEDDHCIIYAVVLQSTGTTFANATLWIVENFGWKYSVCDDTGFVDNFRINFDFTRSEPSVSLESHSILHFILTLSHLSFHLNCIDYDQFASLSALCTLFCLTRSYLFGVSLISRNGYWVTDKSKWCFSSTAPI